MRFTYCLFNYANIFGPFAFSYILIKFYIGPIVEQRPTNTSKSSIPINGMYCGVIDIYFDKMTLNDSHIASQQSK